MGVRFRTVDVDLDLAVLDGRVTPHEETAGGTTPLCLPLFEALSPLDFVRALKCGEDRREEDGSRSSRPREVIFFPASSVDGRPLLDVVISHLLRLHEAGVFCLAEGLGLPRRRMETSLRSDFDEACCMLLELSR